MFGQGITAGQLAAVREACGGGVCDPDRMSHPKGSFAG